ncbi:MAG: C39 family peptidase [Methanosarcinales archaeon]|nr:C39 family peptidase [Methanosarcinales archaeon]
MKKTNFILLVLLLSVASSAIVMANPFHSAKHVDNTATSVLVNTTQNNSNGIYNLSVPYFEQENWYTCGPACLRMVLAFYGINQTENELITISNCTKRGTSPGQLSIAAREFNLQGVSIKNANISDIKQEINADRPVIVLIDPEYIYNRSIDNNGHFIVIVNVRDNMIVYNDPNIQDGKLLYCTSEAFLNAWNAKKNRIVTIKKIY